MLFILAGLINKRPPSSHHDLDRQVTELTVIPQEQPPRRDSGISTASSLFGPRYESLYYIILLYY